MLITKSPRVGGQNKISSESVEINQVRSKNFIHCTGSRIRFHIPTQTIPNSKRVFAQTKGNSSIRQTHRNNATNRGDTPGQTTPHTICKSNICKGRTRKVQTNSQLQRSQRAHRISNIKNGNIDRCQRHAQTKRLDGKNRSQRRFLKRTNEGNNGKKGLLSLTKRRPTNLKGLLLKNPKRKSQLRTQRTQSVIQRRSDPQTANPPSHGHPHHCPHRQKCGEAELQNARMQHQSAAYRGQPRRYTNIRPRAAAAKATQAPET